MIEQLPGMSHRFLARDAGRSTQIERHLKFHFVQLWCRVRSRSSETLDWGNTYREPDPGPNDERVLLLQLFGGLVDSHTRPHEIW